MVQSSQKGPEDANLNLTVRVLLVKPWGQGHDLLQDKDSRCFGGRLMVMGSREFSHQEDHEELLAVVLTGSQTWIL